MRRIIPFLCLILFASSTPVFAEDLPSFTHELTSDSPYYLTGPQQAHPSEGQFKKGDQVTLLQNSGSYSLVQNEKIKAYVSTSSLIEIKKPKH